MYKIKHFVYAFSALMLSIVISGCGGNGLSEQEIRTAKQLVKVFESKFEVLKDHVESPDKSGKYEKMLHKNMILVGNDFSNENVTSLLKSFKKDTTKDGVVFTKMKQSYEQVASNPNYLTLKNESIKNLLKKENFNLNAVTQLIYSSVGALSVDIFDSHFIDYNNMLAEMSDKVKPVLVDSLNKEAPLGNQFVGNPSYGQWQTDSNGDMFWSFFAAYAAIELIDEIGDVASSSYGYRNKYRYDNWSRTRNYSYSNDVYAHRYAPIITRTKYRNFDTSISKNPKYKGKSFSNKSLESQSKVLASKGNKYTPSITKNNVVQTKKTSGYTSVNNQAKANKYTPSITKPSGGHRSSNSSRSRKGGK